MADDKHISLKDLQQTVAEKKQEAAKIQVQSESLAKENNVPVPVEPEAVPQGEKFLAAIGYLSFLCILPLVLKPESALCQFHGKQGLVLLVFFLVFGWIFSAFIGLALGSYILIHNLIVLVHVLFAFYGAYFAFKGEIKKVPLFGSFVEKLDW